MGTKSVERHKTLVLEKVRLQIRIITDPHPANRMEAMERMAQVDMEIENIKSMYRFCDN